MSATKEGLSVAQAAMWLVMKISCQNIDLWITLISLSSFCFWFLSYSSFEYSFFVVFSFLNAL